MCIYVSIYVYIYAHTHLRQSARKLCAAVDSVKHETPQNQPNPTSSVDLVSLPAAAPSRPYKPYTVGCTYVGVI